MKKIIFFLIFLVFLISSCNDKENILNNDELKISAYILNSGSNDISIIGFLDDTSSKLKEINRFSLNENKYPTSFYYMNDPSYIIVSIAGHEINENNHGKLVANDGKQKILFLNSSSGKIEYEIKLNNIPYKVVEYDNKIYVSQSSKYGGYISVFQYSQIKDDFFVIDSIYVGSNLTDFAISYDKINDIKLLTINQTETSLNIYNIYTKEQIATIELGGSMPSNFSEKNSKILNNKYCIIDKLGEKIHVIDNNTNTLEETISLDYQPSDVNILFDKYILILNSKDGNINFYNNEKINWIKYKSFYVGSGVNYFSYKETYFPLFALNTKDNKFLNFNINNPIDNEKINVGNLPISIIDFRN